MKISIVVNTSPTSESFVFIKPFLQIDKIEQIKIFGEGELKKNNKIIYFVDKIKKPKVLKLIYRLYTIIKNSSDCEYIIGIYEIPHGFLAFIASIVLRKKSVLCIIGNPAYSEVRHGLHLFLMKTLIRYMSIVTVTGTKSKDVLIKWHFNENKIFVLPNAIDTDLFIPDNRAKMYDIISLGRLSKEKEIINLLKIVKQIHSNLLPIKVAIAGRGPENKRIKKYIETNEMGSFVDLIGYVENKVEFFNSGKIFVLTSSTEGLPRTVIESMSCGVPCIVSNVGDISDLIENGKNGYLIHDYSDLKSFIEEIMELLNSKEKCHTFGENARSFVLKKYSFNSSLNLWKVILNV